MSGRKPSLDDYDNMSLNWSSYFGLRDGRLKEVDSPEPGGERRFSESQQREARLKNLMKELETPDET
jgi:hypothetical protein